MFPRVVGSAVLVTWALLTLTGCGRHAAKPVSPASDVLATSPDRESAPVPRPWTVPVLDATGGLANWMKCTKFEVGAIVSAYRPDGSFYLTEHTFDIYPWSNVIHVSAREPSANLMWQVDSGRYRPPESDPDRQISPLSAWYREYAEAVLQITTAPVRMMDKGTSTAPRPGTTQITGQWYRALEAKFRAVSPRAKGGGKSVVQPYWTQGIYFQDQNSSLVDMVWLGSPAAEKYVIVRGYDYARTVDGVLLPTRIELFQSDPDANIGSRLAVVDLKQ